MGEDLNWTLSFDYLKESERTKHVHRLHPYKGKFIPQLVEYFLDKHTDDYKKEVYFQDGDIVLDPFCGTGTTMLASMKCNRNSIGIEIDPEYCRKAVKRLERENHGLFPNACFDFSKISQYI